MCIEIYFLFVKVWRERIEIVKSFYLNFFMGKNTKKCNKKAIRFFFAQEV